MAVGPEATEQKAVVRRLRRAKMCFCAVPNERVGMIQGIHFKEMGVQSGAPDLLIFDGPPAAPGRVGTLLEMKTVGAPPSAVSAAQRKFHALLDARGWYVLVGNGAQDALAKLREAGYTL